MTGTRESTLALPQLQGRRMVSDGGMETDLIFHHGADLPHFAAFPLVEQEHGRALLERYYDAYAAIARAAGAGLMLESATWRANSDWGARLGYSQDDLARVNRAAIAMLVELRERYAQTIREVVISGMVGPRGDGYRPAERLEPDEAADYHRPQLDAFAHSGADMATAMTLTHVGEAIGIVRAARQVGLPVAISFTVETDGRLPDGTPLAEAIIAVDRAERPEYFLVNCAHPTHIERGLQDEGAWRERIVGIRANASTKSHAELDEAEELDEGDPRSLAADHARLTELLPNLTIVGGCCGTDARHVASLWRVP
jgi:S-methylmethionine-dependent homocysteine/selenocysteine methylase